MWSQYLSYIFISSIKLYKMELLVQYVSTLYSKYSSKCLYFHSATDNMLVQQFYWKYNPK